jgi:hypothetical protein
MLTVLRLLRHVYPIVPKENLQVRRENPLPRHGGQESLGKRNIFLGVVERWSTPLAEQVLPMLFSSDYYKQRPIPS